jgi:hypothetical protein
LKTNENTKTINSNSYSLYDNVYCQDNDVQAVRNQILDEGLFLFRLEKASWNSTDILLKDYSNLSNQINGYLSYPDNDDTKTVFWDKDGMIIFTVTLDSTGFEKNKVVKVDTRTPTPLETELIKLRNDAFDLLTKNEDNFFAFYKNTSPNLIPIIRSDQRTVFILTGSQENKLLIGNDYRLLFNGKNEVVKKEKLHNSLITINQDSNKEFNKVGSMHTHILENQPYMTSTDICTFMLYMDVFKLKNHVVVSDKGTSIFESDKKRLIIVPQDNSKKK